MQRNEITVDFPNSWVTRILRFQSWRKWANWIDFFNWEKKNGMLRWGDSPIRHQGGGWCPQHLRRGPLWLNNLLTSTNPSGGDHGTSWNFDPIGTCFFGDPLKFPSISDFQVVFTVYLQESTTYIHWDVMGLCDLTRVQWSTNASLPAAFKALCDRGHCHA